MVGEAVQEKGQLVVENSLFNVPPVMQHLRINLRGELKISQ